MAYVGSCKDMCPEGERRTRVGHSVSIFERDQNNEPDEYAMIKEYRRSGADQKEPEPGDLRTIEALEQTLDYLVCNVMDDSRSKTQELALDWYDFLWDRLRAIRKDITQQNICDPNSAILVERCARFHVHSCYAMNRVKDFDVDMNKRNLNDCLQMLRQMYHDLRTTSGTVCAGEMEFQMYDILLHLDEDHLSSNVLMKYSDYRSSKEMRFITKVFNAYTNNDYYKLFQLMRQADYMTSCLLSLYANKIRLSGLKTIINACATRQAVLYPSELAINTLGFDDNEDLLQFTEALGIETQEKDDKLYILLSKDVLTILKQAPSFKSRCLVEDKMQGQSVGQLVHGQTELPANPYGRQTGMRLVKMESNDYDEFMAEDELVNNEERRQLDNEEERVENEEEQNLHDHHEQLSQRHDDSSSPPLSSLNQTLYRASSSMSMLDNHSAPMANLQLVAGLPDADDETAANLVSSMSCPDEAAHAHRDDPDSDSALGKTSDLDSDLTGATKAKLNSLEEAGCASPAANQETSVGGHSHASPAYLLAEQHQQMDNSSTDGCANDHANNPYLPTVMLYPQNDGMHGNSAIICNSTYSGGGSNHLMDSTSNGLVDEADWIEDEKEQVAAEAEDNDDTLWARILRKRKSSLDYKQIADVMPAGYYKVRTLSSAQPTLRLPPRIPGEADMIPNRRFKPVNSPQKKLDSINATIQDEREANILFAHLTNILTRD